MTEIQGTFGIDSIEMANAFEGYACDISRANQDADAKRHGVDMTRLHMESLLSTGRAARKDPSPLWDECVTAAREALGAGASERDVREYAMRLDWYLPPHGAMPPVTATEFAAARGLAASWFYRTGVSEESVEKFVSQSPDEFYPDDLALSKMAPEAVVELVRAAYAKALADAAGAPFLAFQPASYMVDESRFRVDWEEERAEDERRKMLREHGVDLALLCEEEEAAQVPWKHVPWETYFARALSELGPQATEREVHLWARELENERFKRNRVPWDTCMGRAWEVLGQGASDRQIHEYAARVWVGLKPHVGDVLQREAWVRRQVKYMVGGRMAIEFWFNPKAHEELASRIAAYSYLDVPKTELAAELTAGFVEGAQAEKAVYEARQREEHAKREAGKAVVQRLMEGPNPPTLEEIHRAGCEYRIAWGKIHVPKDSTPAAPTTEET
jgi:hypothetical protein